MITYIDRLTGKKMQEKVYGEDALKYLYSHSQTARLLRAAVSRSPLISSLYGWLQSLPSSKKKVAPFIRDFAVDAHEFLDPVDSFQSFNDFFIRKLKPESRPISSAPFVAPADARYLGFQTLSEDTVIVKGQTFNLEALFQNKALADQYRGGSLIMARLCPSDYHRFHFPADCTPGEAKLINGFLYSVNPLAIGQKLSIFWENKRKLTLLDTKDLGQIAYFEVGATNVGSIHETYTPYIPAAKGDEKGYFSFGGSSLLIFLEPGALRLSQDLLDATKEGLELKCLMGQSFGELPKP
jgi:phosphatidylserine decarboxylase